MLLKCNELLLSSEFKIEIFLGWYSLNYTKADNEDRDFVIVKCDSERNNIAIEVENDKTYMIHSCWKLRLWLIGHGKEKNMQVAILAVESVEINRISAKDVDIYSDSKITIVRELQLPLETFQLSAPGTKVVFEGAKLNTASQSLTITDANDILFKDTSFSDVSVKTNFASLVEFRQSTWSNVMWAADQVRNIKVNNGSDINVTLPRMTCKFQFGFPIRSFCSDTKVEISNSSSLNKLSNIKNTYISDSRLMPDIRNQDEDECPHDCFGEESLQHDLERSVKFNNVIKASNLLKGNRTQITYKLLHLAVKSNAYLMVKYLIRIEPNIVNERGPYGRTALFFAGMSFTQFRCYKFTCTIIDD